MKIPLFLLLASLNFCTNNVNSIKSQNEDVSSSTKTYFLDEKEVFQSINVIFLSDTLIEFTLVVKDKVNDCKALFHGIASSNSGDYEIDEDEAGYSYATKEYIYNEKCFIGIRIGVQNDSLLKIKFANCMHVNRDCPILISNKIMHMKEI